MREILVVVNPQNNCADEQFLYGSNIMSHLAKKITEYMDNCLDGDIYILLTNHNDYYLDSIGGKHLDIEQFTEKTGDTYIHNDVCSAIINHDDYVGRVRYIHKKTFGSLNLVKEIKHDLIDDDESEDSLSITIIGVSVEHDIIANALILQAGFPSASISIPLEYCAGRSHYNHNLSVVVMENCGINIIGN